MIRKPVVAGQFYPESREELKKQIKECFESKFGPGLPTEQESEDIKAIISPHAGYSFSGPCAAHGFRIIAESKKPDTYLLIGLSHNIPKSAISMQDWETPMGIVRNNNEFAKIVAKNSSIPVDEDLHANEHSIEVQLPFLQYIDKDAKIVPIIASEDKDPEEFGKAIAESIKEYGKPVIIITSSDFTHYGLNYGYMPFEDNPKENMEKLDKGAIEFIQNNDADGFLSYIEQTGTTICGRIPIAVLLNTTDAKAKLLKYYTSGDITGDYSSAVGYASIAFF